MNWYYAAGGQQQGPVDDAQLDALIQSGTVTLDTLVWREGMASWQPLRQARPGSSTPPNAPPISAAPVAGGIGGDFFDAHAAHAITLLSEDEVLSRGYRIEIGECIERAWKTVTGNLGLVIGATVLLGLVVAFGWLVTWLASKFIPLANILLPSIYMGPILAGYMYVLLRLLRGEDASMSDAFSGFSRNGAQLMLAFLVQAIVGFVCMLPVLLALGITRVSFGMARPTAIPNPSFNQVLLAVLFGAVGAIVVTYLNTLWTHSLLLIIDKGYKFWPAMKLSGRIVSKRWWMTFLFLIVGGILSNVGVIVCCIGLLVSIPVYFAMRASLYDDNFRNLAPVSDPD